MGKRSLFNFKQESRMNPKVVIGVTLIALAGLFVIQNVAVVEIQFLFWSFRISRSLLVLLLLAIGAIIGWFLRGHMRKG